MATSELDMAGSDEQPTDSGQRVLVIDDEDIVCLSCERILRELGHRVDSTTHPGEGLEAALSNDYDVILLDLVMPDLKGIEVLRRLQAAGIRSEVVIITGYSTVETAVAAMKAGAVDYVEKPFTPDELTRTLTRVFERSALIRENAALRRELEIHRGFEGIIGNSPAMERVFSLIKRVAPTQGTVLITGESGTGKEMVARAIHRLSRRAEQPLLICDCSTLAPSLLESELFGHVKGSFTGAYATKKGLFEAAHTGTLFLDEVGNISLETQGKLLRVIETRRVRKVGDTAEREVDIRLIAATNRDLRELVEAGRFREDLFYRLDVVPIHLPPLRERRGDLPLLAVAFLEQFKGRSDIRARRFSPEAMQMLESHSWPGNVRELRNIIERIAILCDSDEIQPHHLPETMRDIGLPVLPDALPETWEELKAVKREVRDAATAQLERRFVLEALRRADGNVSRAAELIGMQRTNLHALMRRHGLSTNDL